MEEWKDIKGYEGLYQISNLGRVKSLPKKYKPNEDIMKQQISCWGYCEISLKKNSKTKKQSFKVHRLVAEAFIPNPENLPQVNHKDENKQNNCVDNLEWCTAQYNTEYTNAKEVYQYNKDLILIAIWKSGVECEKQTNNFKASNIYQCCRGEKKTHKGFIWSYEEIEKPQAS